MKSATAAYVAQRDKTQQSPVYLLRFSHVVTYGLATEWPFSRDYASDLPAGYTVPKLLALDRLSGNTQTIDILKGTSSIGTFSFTLQDVGGELLRAISDPQVILGAPLFADETEWVQARDDISGYQDGPCTIVVDNERVRYDRKDLATKRFHIARNGRGVDGTEVTTHNGSVIHNGEQLRAGQRVQILAGYRSLVESDFMSLAKLEVVNVRMRDSETFLVTVADIQRTLRQIIFTSTSRDAKLSLIGNPITLLLRIYLSTGSATNPAGTVQVVDAQSLIQGAGTNFAALNVGDWIAVDYNTTSEQVVQVASIKSPTELYTVTPLTATAAGRTWRKAGTAGKYDFLGSTTITYSVGKGLVVIEAGNSVRATQTTDGIFLANFVTFLTPGDTVRLNPNATTEQTAVVSKVIDFQRFVSSTKLTVSATPQAWWKQVSTQNKTDGLGIPALYVDVAGLEALRDSQFPSDVFNFSITSPELAKDFIQSQLLRPLNCYPFVTQTGQLSAKRYASAFTPVAVAALTEDDILDWQWDGNEDRITNVCEFQYDWDLTAAPNDYSKRQRYTASASRDKYGPRPPLAITSKGMRTTNGAQAMLDDRARRVLARFAEPPTQLRLAVKYRKHMVEPGDIVSVTHRNIANKRTGLRGMVLEMFEVTDMTPSFGATGGVVLTVENTGALA